MATERPRFNRSTLALAMTISELIRQRQRELNARLEGMQRAAAEDNGGMLPHTEINALCDEMKFLTALGIAWLKHLQSRHPAQPTLTSPPEPRHWQP